MKHKKLIVVICAIVLFLTNNLKAQDDSNAGIYIDGTFVDSIPCWTFDYMYLVFPITNKYKKYDKIRVALTQHYKDKTYVTTGLDVYFAKDFTPEAFFDTFGDAKYGVWKFLTNKNTDKCQVAWSSNVYSRKDFSGKGRYQKDVTFVLEVYGLMPTGYQDNGYGQKVATYGNGTILYKSNKIGASSCKKCPWDVNAPCSVTGKKVQLKIEKSLAYKDDLGIIK